MNVSAFIAGRLRFQGKLAMVSIALSFFIIIIAVSVSAGFRKELWDSVSAMSGDVSVTGTDVDVISEDNPVRVSEIDTESLASVDGVESISPVIYRAGLIKGSESIQGVIFKGTESDSVSLGVRIPSRLKDMLSLNTGDKMVCYFVGEKVKVRKFTVVDVYPSMFDTKDAMIVYLPISDLRRLNGWDNDQVSALEVRLEDSYRNVEDIVDRNAEIGFRLLSEDDETLSHAHVATSVVQRYSQLFDWLDLLDTNVLLVLVLMIIVAGFNMVSGLLILLFRNISTIGILKAMGMTDKVLRSVFLRVSSNLILKGMAIGNALSLLFCFVQDRTHLLRLDESNYFLSFVPVSVNLPKIFLADLVSYAVILIILLLPCIFIGKIDPAKTVRCQ